MNGNVLYVGIDVDDVSYHGSALHRGTGEVLSFQCRPTKKGSRLLPSDKHAKGSVSGATDRAVVSSRHSATNIPLFSSDRLFEARR